jgi:non-specific serine/threonine protein kinase/serine/threonine-protein kinase
MNLADDQTATAIGVEPRAGTRVGPYRLIRELGRGGMGTVLLGVRSDDAFQKRVAIKVLKRGMDTDAIVGRFRNERQILASLEHPYIASLLDGGTTEEGLPYFVMEYVEGQTVDVYCEAHGLDTTARLELFRKTCAAVQYAHQNLIIHRDIKPGNVLVTPDGTPKLLDFGIAKLLNPVLGVHTLAATQAGPPLMTPEYASPEQVRGETVTTATDVYSLGVLLYELLTGRRPYDLSSRTPDEIQRVVCNSVPVRPSTAVTTAATGTGTAGGGPAAAGTVAADRTRPVEADRLRRRLAGDLDNIVLKALAKEPSRRYASVDQFSEDIRRHLSGLPVIARKDTIRYRTTKFIRRNRAAVAAAALVTLALIAGLIGTAWQARIAGQERARAEGRFDDVRELANASLFELHDAIRDLPGSTPARKLLVSKGLAYLDKLSRDAGDRPDLKRELAGGYVKVGDVQGRPLNPNLGDSAGALESYHKATALYESLGARTSTDQALRRELALAYLRMSEILGSMGQTAGSLDYARQSVAVLREAADMTPGDGALSPGLRRELAAGYSRVGDLLSATGDTSGALEHRRLALAMMETLAPADAADPDNIRQLGVAHQKLANSLGNPNYPNIGDHAGALEHLTRAAEVFRKALESYPANVLFRRNLAVVDSNTADVLLALRRPGEALERQRAAQASFEALAAADPTNAAAKNDIAISRSKIAEMLDANGRSAEAIVEYGAALAIHQALATADPDNDGMQLELASDYNRLATAQAHAGIRAASLANHGRAVALVRELRAANAANVELGVALALGLLGRGDAYAGFARRPGAASRAADLAAAERDYVEAIEILTALQAAGSIEGTDLTTLENARKELERIRRERGR